MRQYQANRLIHFGLANMVGRTARTLPLAAVSVGRAHRGWQAQRALRGGKPVCCVNILPGAALTGPREAAPAFTRPCVTGDVLAEADVLFLRRLLV